VIAGVAFAWSVDRAAGIAALLLASATIVVGLMHSVGGKGRRLPALESHTLHEGLSIAVLVAIAIHGAAFAFDPFFHSGVVAALVPFDSPFRPLAVGLGQLSAYGLIALSLSFYLRRRIGTPRWRKAHRFIPAFWALGVLHALFTGSDVSEPWFLLAVVPPVLAAALAVAQRWDARSAAKAADRAPSARPAARDGSARERARPSRTAPVASRAGR
jgi:sulfoxide reductase heme-binding subunit YedZ